MEPLVVGPPHAAAGAAPRRPDRGVAVPVHELLLQQPVRRLDHGVAVGAAPARRRSFDVEHVEQLVDPRVVELAAPAGAEHLDAHQREVERAERGQHQARVPGPPGGMAGDAPVRQAGQQAHVRPASADADIGKVARRMRVRGVAVGPAGPAGSRAWPRRPASRAVRTVCACTRPHALFAHDVADASPGRGDALPFQGGLDLPGAVASVAVAPISGGVGPYHACLRANTGAACPETSASISNRRSRMPWTQRRGADRAMSYPALISRDGLPLSHDCTIRRLNASS